MADADIEIEGIIQKGKLLTLTSQEAAELNFIDGITSSIDDILYLSNLQNVPLRELSPSFQLRLASMATSTTATSILLTLGFIGIIVEFFTPGFGMGGVISLSAFTLYFGGLLFAGFSSWVILAVFLIGIILLLVEMFVPGFGVPGILGIIAIFASIVLASSSIEQALMSIVIAILLTIIAGVLIFKYAPRNNKFFDRITLSTSLSTKGGYISTADYSEYVGKTGVAISPLRPSGSIEIDGRKLDAVSEGDFIERDEQIKVIKVEGSRIIVKNRLKEGSLYATNCRLNYHRCVNIYCNIHHFELYSCWFMDRCISSQGAYRDFYSHRYAFKEGGPKTNCRTPC